MPRRIKPAQGPKPDKLCRDALMIELAEEVSITEGPERGKKFKKLRLVARSLVNSAIKGDTGATKEIFDRMDGKVALKVAGDPDAPIKHEHAGQVDVDANTTVTIKQFDPAELAKLTIAELGVLYEQEAHKVTSREPESSAGKRRNRTVPAKPRVPAR